MTVSPTRTRTREPDEACAEAVDLARDAIVAVVGAVVTGFFAVETKGRVLEDVSP